MERVKVMAELLELKYGIREDFGKKSTEEYRRNGLVPGVGYGSGRKKNIHILLNLKEFISNLQNIKFKIFKISSRTGKDEDYRVLVKSIQRDPISNRIIHIDFLIITDENKEIFFDVPIVFINYDKCTGIKMGGNLNMVKRKVKVKCLPTSLPRLFEVDLQNLDIGSSFTTEDLPITDDVTIVSKTNKPDIIATIVGRKKRKVDSSVDNTTDAPHATKATEVS